MRKAHQLFSKTKKTLEIISEIYTLLCIYQKISFILLRIRKKPNTKIRPRLMPLDPRRAVCSGKKENDVC